jgi:hypothetical protein
MKMETQELDELMRGADGVTGDVRDALYEAVGVRPTQCAQWESGCTVHQMTPNHRNATEIAGGAPTG